jgi:hypothetical protein
MQNILILTVLLNILMKVAVQCERERISTRTGLEWTINPTTFGPTLLIIEKILGKMKTSKF